MALYYDIRVDVSADKVLDSGYHFTANDSKQIFLRIAVMNGAEKFVFDDANQVTINFRKPDGTFVEGTPTLSDDVFLYQFVGNELQAAGKVVCDIKFAYESGRLSSGMFSFVVDNDTASETTIKSTSYIPALEQAKQDAISMVGEITTAKDSIKGYSDNATAMAVRSESFAHGNTGERAGENTDNAKYYSEQAGIYKSQAETYLDKFKYSYFGYASKPDGSDMTETPQSNTLYIGVYCGTATTRPGAYNQYTWSRMRGEDGNAYFATFDIVDGAIIMTWNSDTQNLSFTINETTGELEVTT